MLSSESDYGSVQQELCKKVKKFNTLSEFREEEVSKVRQGDGSEEEADGLSVSRHLVLEAERGF